MAHLDYFRARRILVTGHTGFKGAWLCAWLLRLGGHVTGLSLAPQPGSLFEALHLEDEVRSHTGDIRDEGFVRRVLAQERPEIVFHLAAQSLVRQSQREPVSTFATNVQGTVHVLEAVRQVESVRAVVCVTSDKCYDNRGWDWGYRENDPLGGDDPYSASKACAEMVASAYRRSFFERTDDPVGLATVRAGNVLGGGDRAEDRILPDAMRALAAGEPISIRRPGSVRPWQHVLEALAGYLALVPKLVTSPRQYAGPWNFGPLAENAVSVRELIEQVLLAWGSGRTALAPGSEDEPIEAGCLRLAIDKAITRLPWRPCWDLGTTVRHTVAWYRAQQLDASPAALRALCHEQIEAYESAAIGRPAHPLSIPVEPFRKRASA
jgi:CDP-glucose 4,6-dehydratase